MKKIISSFLICTCLTLWTYFFSEVIWSALFHNKNHEGCCWWCTIEVVLSLFNVLNEHFTILVKHMVNRSILIIWYSFAIADSIEEE